MVDKVKAFRSRIMQEVGGNGTMAPWQAANLASDTLTYSKQHVEAQAPGVWEQDDAAELLFVMLGRHRIYPWFSDDPRRCRVTLMVPSGYADRCCRVGLCVPLSEVV